MAIFPMREMRVRWLLHCAAAGAVFVLAASPVLLLNTIQFHSPFRTGYDFWTPFFSKNHLFFSLRYIPNNAVAIWNEFALGRSTITLRIFSEPVPALSRPSFF